MQMTEAIRQLKNTLLQSYFLTYYHRKAWKVIFCFSVLELTKRERERERG